MTPDVTLESPDFSREFLLEGPALWPHYLSSSTTARTKSTQSPGARASCGFSVRCSCLAQRWPMYLSQDCSGVPAWTPLRTSRPMRLWTSLGQRAAVLDLHVDSPSPTKTRVFADQCPCPVQRAVRNDGRSRRVTQRSRNAGRQGGTLLYHSGFPAIRALHCLRVTGAPHPSSSLASRARRAAGAQGPPIVLHNRRKNERPSLTDAARRPRR